MPPRPETTGSPLSKKDARILLLEHFQATATAVRHVSIAPLVLGFPETGIFTARLGRPGRAKPPARVAADPCVQNPLTPLTLRLDLSFKG